MSRERELPLSTRLSYSLGAVAFGLKDTGFSYLLLIFYNQVIGLSTALVGTAVMIALIADAFLDPIIGQITDNWRSPLGRRHPFMYVSALPAAVTYLLLWIPPKGWSPDLLFFYLIATAILARTSLSFFEIPSTALSAELVSDYDARTRLISMRALFQWYGSLLMTLATFYVFFHTDVADPHAQLARRGYANYGIAAAIIIFAVIAASTIGTHSEIKNLHTPPRRPFKPLTTLKEMAETLANRSFSAWVFAGIADAMGYGLSVSLSLYFNTYFWSLTIQQIALFPLSQLFSSIFAAMAATPLSRLMGKRNAAIFAKVMAFLFGVHPLVLRMLGVFPPNGSPILLPWLVVNNLISVTFSSVAAILGSAMISDVVEDSELKTGRRSEGLLFSTMFFMGKAVSGVGIFASSMLLLFVGFPDAGHKATVSADILTRLGWTYVPVQAVIVAIYIALISRYAITRSSHAETLTRLAVLRPGSEL